MCETCHVRRVHARVCACACVSRWTTHRAIDQCHSIRERQLGAPQCVLPALIIKTKAMDRPSAGHPLQPHLQLALLADV